ncbi:hypothetical protein [Neobacillus dielmonensis]|uniref:hypothetical protein n=1 Tax=Neobacillus dielmonensis TaxID=1347369 RepID=UPI0005AB1451|nr:hypothetical protein [Neobacillus dielmonensis]
MSVSLALIPVALALRAVMHKDVFDEWSKSMQVIVPTTIETEAELISTLYKSGYDAEKYGGTIKTHLNNKEQFFFWEYIDGKWHAIFAKSDSPAMLETFMCDLEEKAQRQIFTGSIHQEEERIGQDTVQTFPTNFRDGNILVRTLKEFGVNPIQGANGQITCNLQGTYLTFRQHGDAPFSIEIKNPPNLHDIFLYISDLDEEYKRCVQAIVYEKLKQRAAEKNLLIESEEIMEDNSIVITLNIQG